MFTGIVREFLAGLLALLMTAAPAATTVQPAEEPAYVQEIEDISPARTLSATAGTLSLDVDSPVGSLPKAAKASLSKVSKAKLNKIRKEAASLLGTEIIDAVAFDISFLNNGIEIEPDGKVNITVNFPAIAVAPSYTIIHFRDDGTTEIVPGNVTATSATFSADNFSVYAVIATEIYFLTVEFYNNTTKIASMSIKKDDSETEVEKIIYDPGVGEITSGEAFKGWAVGTGDVPDYITSSVLKTIADIRSDALTEVATLTANKTVKYNAAIFKSYTVTYQSNDATPITVGTTAVEYPAYRAEPVEAPLTVNMGFSVDSAHNFEGWMALDSVSQSHIKGYPEGAKSETVGTGSEAVTVYYYENGTAITITGDVTFTAKAPEGNWLIFDENGKGGKYNAPQFVLKDETTSKPCADADMTRYGYSFVGWYYFPEGATVPDQDAHQYRDLTNALPYTFGGSLEKTTTVYAQWTPNSTAPYTVIFWTQDLSSINKDIKKYEVAGSYPVSDGPVGQNIPYTVVDNGNEDYVTGCGDNNGHYTGFCLTESSRNQNIKITPEGDAVLNLYYDRIQYNFKFYLYRSGNNNNSYDYANNSGSGSSLDELVTWHRNQDEHPSVTGQTIQSESVSGRTYYYFVMQAFYGEDISSKWPTYDKITGANNREAVSFVMMVGTKLKPNPTSQGSGTVKGVITVLDENILGATNNSNGNYVIIRFPDNYNNWRYHIWFETIEGEDYSNKTTHTYNGKTYYQDTVLTVRSSNTTDANQNEPKYTGFDYVTRLGQNSTTGVWEGGHWTTTQNGTTLYHLNYVYDRQQFKISYFDGQYVDGNNNNIQNKSSSPLHESGIIAQGAIIPDENKNYKPSLPSGEQGYVFEGWFLDEGCTTLYDWGDMPVGGIVVYAKWRMIQYRVFLHTNVPTSDNTLSWGSATQALSFRINFGKTASAPTGTRTGYIFQGWYTDPNFKNAFNQMAYVLNEETVTTLYDKTTTKTDPENRPWEIDSSAPNAYNSDLTGWDDDNNSDTPGKDRYWITKKLDLYAKWSKVLIGADGIKVVYTADGFDAAGNSVTGSGAPVDNATYIENSNVSAGAAATAPFGYVFDHWVVETYDQSAGEFTYSTSSVTVLPGETFAVKESDARVVDNSDETKTYTVQVCAIYKKIEASSPKHIIFFGNGGTKVSGIPESTTQGTVNETKYVGYKTLMANEPVDIAPASTFDFGDNRFLGWARISEPDGFFTIAENGTITIDPSKLSVQDLNEDDLWLVYHPAEGTNDAYWTCVIDNATKTVTQIAADEKNPNQLLYAVWEKPFYVYHSGVAGGAAGNEGLEKGFVSDLKGEKYNLTKNLTADTLYGGYYLESGITKPSDGAAYDGTNWTWTTPVTGEKGTAISPVSGTTYYVKEVPVAYLKPYTHIGFTGGVITSLMMVTAIDDLTYDNVGFIVNDAVALTEPTAWYRSLRIRNGNGVVTYTLDFDQNNVFAGVKNGYVGYSILNRPAIDPNKTLTIKIAWVTPDKVTVNGIVARTITTGDGTTDTTTGFKCSDTTIASVLK